MVASTRTGSSASASSATRSSRHSGSCEVLGAITTSGSPPSGTAVSSPSGSSKKSGPLTRTFAGHRRGYSSWGKVATTASSSLIPP